MRVVVVAATAAAALFVKQCGLIMNMSNELEIFQSKHFSWVDHTQKNRQCYIYMSVCALGALCIFTWSVKRYSHLKHRGE